MLIFNVLDASRILNYWNIRQTFWNILQKLWIINAKYLDFNSNSVIFDL